MWTTYGAEAVLAGTGVPQTLWVQLHSGAPGDAGTANVCVETDRQSIALEASVEPRTVVNDAAATWSDLPADETATHLSLWDAETGGNCWAVGVWDPVLDLSVGGSVQAAAGRIQLVLALGV